MKEWLDWLGIACFAALVLLPGVLLAVRWRRAAAMSWARFAWLVILGGWVLVVAGAACFQYAQMLEVEALGGEASPEMVENLRSGMVGWALALGWAYGPMCSLPWLAAYGVGQWGRGLLRRP